MIRGLCLALLVAAAAAVHPMCETVDVKANTKQLLDVLDNYNSRTEVPTKYEDRVAARGLFREWVNTFLVLPTDDDDPTETKTIDQIVEGIADRSGTAARFAMCAAISPEVSAKCEELLPKLKAAVPPETDDVFVPEFEDEILAFAEVMIGVKDDYDASAAVEKHPHWMTQVPVAIKARFRSMVRARGVRGAAARAAVAPPPWRARHCNGLTLFPRCRGNNRNAVETADLSATCADSSGDQFGATAAEVWTGANCPVPAVGHGGPEGAVIVGFKDDIDAACPTQSVNCRVWGGKNCGAEGYNRLSMGAGNYNQCVNMHWVNCGVSGHYPSRARREWYLATAPYTLSRRFNRGVQIVGATVSELCTLRASCDNLIFSGDDAHRAGSTITCA